MSIEGEPKRIVTAIQDEPHPNTWSDFTWVRENTTELLEKYGERVIAVFEKEVVGVGDTWLEAKQDADGRLPAHIERITPIIHHLSYSYRIIGVTEPEEAANE